MLKLLGQKLEDVMLNSKIHPTALTKNNYFIKKIFTDKLMLPFLSMKSAKSIIEGTQYVLPNAHKFNSPLLIIHGELDSVSNHLDSVTFYNKCSS
jgi:hypothetical protein